MRVLLLIAGAAVALAACGKNNQTDKTGNADENLTAENIVSNDVTAIDAVTGDAANMAADVDMNFGTAGQANAAAAAPNDVTPPSRPATKRPHQSTLAPAPERSMTTANSQ